MYYAVLMFKNMHLCIFLYIKKCFNAFFYMLNNNWVSDMYEKNYL